MLKEEKKRIKQEVSLKVIFYKKQSKTISKPIKCILRSAYMA